MLPYESNCTRTKADVESPGKVAQGEFDEVSKEVATLHTALKEVSDEVQNPRSVLNRSATSKKSELEAILTNCRYTLASLDNVLRKHGSLGSSRPRMLDKFRFGRKDLSPIRTQLAAHKSNIELFLALLGIAGLNLIEERLDEMVQEMRNGNREPTTIIIDWSRDQPSDVHWHQLSNELKRTGVSTSYLRTHRNGICAYLQEQIEERLLSDSGGSDEGLPPIYEQSSEDEDVRRSGESIPEAGAPGQLGIREMNRSTLPLNIWLPPAVPLPALPSGRRSTEAIRGAVAYPTLSMDPDIDALCCGSSTDIFDTETEVQEYDDQGRLRKRSITRRSSNNSIGSSLPSTRSSLTLAPSFRDFPLPASADFKEEDWKYHGPLPRNASSRRSSTSHSSRTLVSGTDQELESWKHQAKFFKELWIKQKKQTGTAETLELEARQSLLETMLERDKYKIELDELAAIDRLSSQCVYCANAGSATKEKVVDASSYEQQGTDTKGQGLALSLLAEDSLHECRVDSPAMAPAVSILILPEQLEDWSTLTVQEWESLTMEL